MLLCAYRRLRPASCWAATLSLLSGSWIASAFPQQDSANQPRDAQALLRWAEASRLTGEWEFKPQLLRTDHPSGKGKAWTLNVRFIRLLSDRDDDQEKGRLEKFLSDYQASVGLTFPDKVFYKFTQICELPEDEAVVHFLVGTDDLAVYVDPASGALVSKLKGRRFTTDSVFIKLPENPAQARKLTATVASAPAAIDWPQKVRTFLEEYFRSGNRNAKLPEPRIVPNCHGNHVGLTVSGLRKQVFPDGSHWEKIQVEADVWSVAGGVLVSANIDCFYAGGFAGFGLPTDYPSSADHDAPTQLSEFSRILFDKLTQALKQGAP